jgi:hypothetical protein
MTWRAKDRWLGKFPKVLPKVIEKHFDGNKFPEYHAFWNLEGEWEALVICPNNKCSHYFQTFPPTRKCEKLLQHWDLDINYYRFPCSKCSTLINV